MVNQYKNGNGDRHTFKVHVLGCHVGEDIKNDLINLFLPFPNSVVLAECSKECKRILSCLQIPLSVSCKLSEQLANPPLKHELVTARRCSD